MNKWSHLHTISKYILVFYAYSEYRLYIPAKNDHGLTYFYHVSASLNKCVHMVENGPII
jgi:hypothetical protein